MLSQKKVDYILMLSSVSYMTLRKAFCFLALSSMKNWGNIPSCFQIPLFYLAVNRVNIETSQCHYFSDYNSNINSQ